MTHVEVEKEFIFTICALGRVHWEKCPWLMERDSFPCFDVIIHDSDITNIRVCFAYVLKALKMFVKPSVISCFKLGLMHFSSICV